MPVDSSRRFSSPYQPTPRTLLLSNGSYSLMLTAAGSGFSRWRDIALTRWREDPTCDPWGSYIFLRDVFNGHVWSAGYQPIGRESEFYEATFFEDRAEIRRKDGPIRTLLEIFVSSEDDAEVRHLSLTNEGSGVREIELTSYAEVVLSPPAADSAHPAFSKMFVQTEYVAERGALLATRRPREPGQAQPWMVHFTSLDAEAVGGLQFETDRARFIGRGHDVRNAVSVMDARPLSNTVGTVLDPVLALRRRVRIDPGETVHAAFWTGIGATRAQALEPGRQARQRSGVSARQDAVLGQDRSSAARLEAGRRGRAAVSGDCRADFVFRRIAARRAGAARAQSARAVGFVEVRRLGRFTDRRVPDRGAGRRRCGQAAVAGASLLAVKMSGGGSGHFECGRPRRRGGGAGGRGCRHPERREGPRGSHARGKVIALRADAMPAEHGDFLQTAARVLFNGRAALREQCARPETPAGAARLRRENRGEELRTHAPHLVPTLEYFNGLGGFDAGAREYVVVLDDGQWTPAPWINVIANPQFGFLVSADGAGSTWSLNAQQNQITPWSNDPVSDTPAEAIYVRDEDSGDLWSVTPLPIRERSSVYVVRHGFGYTRTEHTSHGIALTLTQFVPLEDSIKISRLKIVNASDVPRQLSVTHYLDWMLGNQNNRAAPFIITSFDPKTRALLARNPWTSDFKSRVAFLDMAGRQQSCTGDRTEFIGRHGTLAEPAALLGPQNLSNRVGGGLDPCGAMQTKISLGVGRDRRADAAARRGEFRRRGARADRTLSQRESRCALQGRDGLLGSHPRRHTGQDAGSLHGHPGQRLAAVSDLELPGVGAHGLLSVERRLWLSRSAAGRHGAVRILARDRARAHLKSRRAAIRRGRCAALVAAHLGPGNQDAGVR